MKKRTVPNCRPRSAGFIAIAFAPLLAPVLAACQFASSEGNEQLHRQFDRQTQEIELDPPASVSWLEAGPEEARPVVYVHGTPGSAAAWFNYLRDPIPGLHAITYDRPGFGLSTTGHAYSSLEDQARVIDALVRAQNSTEKPILVGHSLGGPIVCRYAADHPEQVGGLVIVAGALDPSLERVRLIQWVGCAPPIVWLLPPYLRNANRELIPLEGELEELKSDLGRIKCPIIIIHGTEDSLVPYANVPFMERAFADNAAVTVITIEGGNHFLPWNNEQIVRDAISEMAQAQSDETR